MSKVPFQLDTYDGTDSPTNEVARFVVLYGKTSTRKHKIWDGDGILICYADSCILKSDDEKDVITRSAALKRLEDLDDGRVIVLGSWSVEIQEKVGVKNDMKLTTSSNPPTAIRPLPIAPPLKKRPFSSVLPNQQFSSPIASKKSFVSPMLGMNGEAPEKIEHFILNEKEVLARTESPICVDPRFTKVLREHQKQGIQFIFDGLKEERGGVILADEMGLGKSIQTMAATWALMKGSKTQNIASKTLLVVPSSLTNNWKAEFNKWFRMMLFPAIILQKPSDIDSYITTQKSHPYLVISYDMALRYVEKLRMVRFDVIVCDEGHKLKNKDSKLRKSLASLDIPRKLILTGTPMQNDYDEFYSLLDFVRPSHFGSLPQFLKLCSDDAEKLNEMIDRCMLRRTSEVNNSHLPEKHEYVLFCGASELQKKVHEEICEYMTGDALSLIFFARQLVNHPKLMYDNLMEKHEKGNHKHSGLISTFPEQYAPRGGVKESGKLSTLVDMLKCFRIVNECAVVVSNYIETLDMIEQLCCYLEFNVFRLDGKTNVQDRQKLVKKFNEDHNPHNVFLLSTKAGGVGLNLIGASRLVLYDSDWNPANDLQAMARIWRDGQIRPCHIYRLVTTGTIEEKMLQRQIKKTGLGCVIDAIEVGDAVSTFTDEELRDIFDFTPDTECNTHDLSGCKCDGSGMLEYELVESDDDMEDVDDEELEEDSNGNDEVVEDSPEQENNPDDGKNAVITAAAIDENAENSRASLAELSRWRHFSPRYADTWKHFMTTSGLSQADTDVELTFAFYITSQF